MKRRHFIRTLGLAGLTHGLAGKALASEACCSIHAAYAASTGSIPTLKLLQSLTLTEFQKEQEEGPCLVTDGAGGEWLFSLRRLPYPKDAELISCFANADGDWVEMDPVTSQAGKYEAMTASCCRGGDPVVAWSRKDGNDWSIMAARKYGAGFEKPEEFRAASGRNINPVLISPEPGRHWLAWECYDRGLFSIYVSKFERGRWSEPLMISEARRSLMYPALAESRDGTVYLAYEISDGPHRNIEMKQIDGRRMKVLDTIPVAIGGSLTNRVNMNTKPSLAFDREDRLWISWENNRRTHRLEDGDNFTGDRICAAVCYQDGKIMEPAGHGRWLFDGKNDHLPTFVKDYNDNLFILTHCGGDFVGNAFWKYRISWLDPEKGWTEPETIFETRQKGETSRPAVIFDGKGHFWMAVNPEQWFTDQETAGFEDEKALSIRASKLELHQFRAPEVSKTGRSRMQFREAMVEEHHPVRNFHPEFSGRPRIPRKKVTYKGETYTLILGNLHEHSENSSCWPAGCDGTLHDDYRFGILSEGYDFCGITDHGYSLTEVYWRRNLRLADFYNDDDYFVAVPSMEWTLSNSGSLEIRHGVGHKNVIFPSTEEALKFIRSKYEIYSWRVPETMNAVKLWEHLHRQKIDCVTIPHHPADEVHTSDWDVHDPHYETVVEIFQCRGNAEYPGCPRVINVSRHKPTPNKKAFIDYALREKGYKMGFIASGDHNGYGVGIAALWVKEVSRKGIVEALKSGRCFATTGDKMYVDMQVNGAWCCDTTKTTGSPEITCEVEAVQPIKSVELMRDSRVLHRFPVKGDTKRFRGSFTDRDLPKGSQSAYYYLRAIQQDNHIGWSSPVWVERA